MPDIAPSSVDQDELRAALIALFGADGYAALQGWIEAILAGGIANPTFVPLLTGTTYPEHSPITLYVKTNRWDLNYDILLYKHPDLVHPILPYYTNIVGAPMFG